MLLLRKPKLATIHSFLDAQAKLGFTYQAVGATRGTPPEGYVVDHTRVKLGRGEQVFTSARSALETWRQFGLGWLEAGTLDWLATGTAGPSIRAGATVAIVAHSIGFWWLNACRIVYVIDEQARPQKFGFAYGTLPDHAGSGEERFLVEMDDEGFVWYDILAFSRPQHPLARLGYPYVRRVQKRFGKQSARAMQAFVDSTRLAKVSR